MKDIELKLQMRLKSVARGNWYENKEAGGQCALMYIELLKHNGQVIGWLKPEVKPIEPRDFKPNDVGLSQNGLSWELAISSLTPYTRGVLLVQRGEPVLWLTLT